MMKNIRIPSSGNDPFKERVLSHGEKLTPSAYRVAAFIDKNRAAVLAASAVDLATSLGTSDATIVRTVQALGFSGIAEMKKELAATLEGAATPAAEMGRTLSDVGGDTDRAIELALTAHADAVKALQRGQARATLTKAVQALHPAERVVVFGIGPSASLAHYVSALLHRHGRKAYVVDATGAALADQLLDLRAGDALLVMAYGRAYPEVVALFAEGRRLRLAIVLITDSLDEQLQRQADVVIPTKRGKAERAALHGATLVTLEALILGLAAADQRRSMDSLRRLAELRQLVAGGRGTSG